MPTVGAPAPALSGSTDQGSYDLTQAQGPVIVYFYPKDMTPGCTIEAQDFGRLNDDFTALGATVVGVSRDSAKRHAKFREKQCIPFPLVADEDGSICESWGVWQEKKNYGKTYMGIVRSTFLVNADGTVAQVWDKVRVKGHAEAVLEATRSLS